MYRVPFYFSRYDYTLMKDDKKIAVALNTVPGFRAIVCQRALSRYGSATGILEAGKKGLLSLPGSGASMAEKIGKLAVEEIWERESSMAGTWGARIVTLAEEGYPVKLRQIPDPPQVLYLRGKLLEEDSDALAVVGSRAATEYGRLTAERLARDLAARGVTVVSGMARGIDSCAHRGALGSGGRTIAVLGSGLDRLYPPENRGLAGEISSSGAVLTEFPFGFGPEKWHFPLRNRTISGLSLGIVVVEAAARSGALITAGLALEQGREVFAVPGNITSSRSAGTNGLIKEGAKPVTNVADVLEEFPRLEGRIVSTPMVEAALSIDERKVLSRIGTEPVTIDDLIRGASVPSARTVSLLTALELKGLVRQFVGGRYGRL